MKSTTNDRSVVQIPEEYSDGRSSNKRAVKDITQKWVENVMNGRENEFTSKASGKIFCGTWNVNAKKQEGGLQEWLLPSNISDHSSIDIYAIGFQEIVDLNATNVMLDSSKTQSRSQFWQEKIEECINVKGGSKYKLLMSKALVGLLLCVYAKEKIVPHIKDIRSTQQATGILGVMGNKGGVCVRLSLYDTSVCFVCAHLAAHRENVVGRNADYKTIVEGILFGVNKKLQQANVQSITEKKLVSVLDSDVLDNNYTKKSIHMSNDMVNRPLRGALLNQTMDLSLLDHHELIFWIGDLNYRIDDSISTEEVFSKIKEKDLKTLRDNDQLNNERHKGNAFTSFEEGVMDFDPTYKYQPGSDVYDQRPDRKVRAPAWCDRILWRTTLNHDKNSQKKVYNISQLTYQRANLLPSDHKPVSSLFEVDLRVLVDAQESKVYDEVMRSLEFWKNDDIPTVQLETDLVDMGHVKYNVPTKQVFKISNNSSAIVYWRFVSKSEDWSECKRWIHLGTKKGLLLPNESAEVEIMVRVDMVTARALSAGKEVLEDVLLLRLENGHDKCIPVSAVYDRSCFGMSLEALVQTPNTAVRDIPLVGYIPRSDITEDNGVGAEALLLNGAHLDATNAKKETPLSIPKELWRLVDALYSGNALREKDLFAMPGDVAEINSIREALDCGEEFLTSCSPHSYAAALQEFLQALPSPLLSFDLYPSHELDTLPHLRSWCRKFLDSLLPLNYNVFVYLISFMREVLQQKEYNRSTTEKITEICLQIMTGCESPNVFLNKDDLGRRLNKQLNMRSVLFYFLTSDSI